MTAARHRTRPVKNENADTDKFLTEAESVENKMKQTLKFCNKTVTYL